MIFTVFDVETNGLRKKVSKIHCLSYQIYDNNKFVSKGTITDLEKMKLFLSIQDNLVGHNIVKYDVPVIEQILGLSISQKLIDTLSISWYLFPNRKKHGLQSWGYQYNYPKPPIDDWEELPLEEYINRCEVDVEINSRLFLETYEYLLRIYDTMSATNDFISYLTFKMDCLKEQEEVGITLNEPLAISHAETLEKEFIDKTNILSAIMPKDLGTVIKTKPKNMFKQDGTVSVLGQKWLDYLTEHKLPMTTQIVQNLPNPGSDVQLKTWLFRLGWKPETFKVSKSEGNKGEKIPQVSLPFGAGICKSVKVLYEKEPNLVELEGYFKTKHRIGVFESYLKNLEDGKVVASAHGFTNTLRLTHSKPVKFHCGFKTALIAGNS